MNLKTKTQYSVLLVDDDQAILDLLKDSFLDLSFEVYIASSGDEALIFLSHKKVDCIVTDIAMPGMDGLEFIKRLQAKKDQTPFFFITGYLDYLREDLNSLKPRAIIFKPFDLEEMAMLVKGTLMREA